MTIGFLGFHQLNIHERFRLKKFFVSGLFSLCNIRFTCITLIVNSRPKITNIKFTRVLKFSHSKGIFF